MAFRRGAVLILVVLGLIWLLSQAAGLNEMKTRDDPPAPKSGRSIR